MRTDSVHHPTAVLSMDVEDWFHLDYFDRARCDTSASLLDGLDRYQALLAEEGIPSSFFVLGELTDVVARRMDHQPDIGIHGWSHRRPLTLSVEEFASDVKRSKDAVEQKLGRAVEGHRAPCFSLDRARLDIVQELGFSYDSSRIQFSSHPLYGTLDLTGYESVRPWVYQRGGFFEFEVSTTRLGRHTIPISGGGYLRLLPWRVMHRLLTRYLEHESLFVLYIHPFELSRQADPRLPDGTGWPTRVRFSRGRSHTEQRLRMLIALLREKGFSFTTFAQLRNEILTTGCQRTTGT